MENRQKENYSLCSVFVIDGQINDGKLQQKGEENKNNKNTNEAIQKLLFKCTRNDFNVDRPNERANDVKRSKERMKSEVRKIQMVEWSSSAQMQQSFSHISFHATLKRFDE